MRGKGNINLEFNLKLENKSLFVQKLKREVLKISLNFLRIITFIPKLLIDLKTFST